MTEMIAVASAVPAMSAHGQDRLDRALATIRQELAPLDFAAEISKRDELLALA
jgi:hypothetical protein